MKQQYKIYGYSIEFRYKKWELSNWEIYWNRKVYIDKKAAEEAISYIRKSISLDNWDFRIVPVYIKQWNEKPK